MGARDGFEIDREGARLLRDGVEVPIEKKTLDLLCYLAEHPGRLIRKDELIERVWKASAMSDGALSNAIAKLRKALGQGARDREPIETVHGRGYRFHAKHQPAPAALGAPSEPFVGRHELIEQLEGVLEQVAAGAGRLILLSGEAGIGKSRLLSELALRACARGFGVRRGLCYPGGVAPAYWPWVEIIRDALGDASVRRALPSDTWAIASLTPELLAPSALAQDAQALRFRLFDELARWFSGAAAHTPQLIVIDDLQWADHSSIELLDHLARALTRQRVLLAVAQRPPLAEPDDAASFAMQRLLRPALHKPLTGLSREEVAQWMAALVAPPLDERFSELLHANTQGNPFFIQQVVQLIAQRNETLSQAGLARSGLPPAVREVIQQRLRTLPVETRSLLRVAAVVGLSFEAALLARVCDQPLPFVLRTLDPALRFQLVRGREQRFELTHALLCDTLYEELSLDARSALHATLARVLADQASDADPRSLAELVRHDLLAVPFHPEVAAAHARRAAAAARETSGFEAAASMLERVIARLALEGDQAERRCELLHELGLDWYCAGDIGRARRTLADAARLASETGSSHWLARVVCRLTSWFEHAGFRQEASALLSLSLAQVGSSEPEYATLLARHAQSDPHLTAGERAELFARAQRLADESGNAELMQDVAIARVCLRDPAQLPASRAAVTAYRTLIQAQSIAPGGAEQRMRHFSVGLTEYWCALLEGDLAAADSSLSQCQAALDTCRVPQLELLFGMVRCMRAISDGRLSDASFELERLRELDERTGGPCDAWLYCSLRLAEAKGDVEALHSLSQHADMTAFERLTPRQAADGHAWAAAAAAQHGHAAIARWFLTRIPSSEIARMPTASGDLALLCSLAEAYAALGDASCADALYAQLAPHAAHNAVGIALQYLGSVEHHLGLLALLRGKPERAVEHAQAALVFNQKLPSPPCVARSQRLLAAASARCTRS